MGHNDADLQLRHRYDDQASRYDSSRGVGASTLALLLEALSDAPGREVVDVGCGTGNYSEALAAHGFAVTAVDVDPAMLAQAAAKGLDVLEGAAESLPLADASQDGVAMVSMLHQVESWPAALREAVRVLRPGGRLAASLITADHIERVSWAFDLFPTMRAFALPRRPSIADLLGAFPGSRVVAGEFDDLGDGSIGALCRYPTAMLDPRLRAQTSFFEKLAAVAPGEVERGLEELRRRLDTGDDPAAERAAARAEIGDFSVLMYAKPGSSVTA